MNDNTIAIGIDPGNYSGAAAVLLDSRGIVVLSTSTGRHAPKDTEFDVERWESYVGWLTSFVDMVLEAFESPPEVVFAFEDVKGHRSRKSAQVYGGYRALTLEEFGTFPFCLVHTGTLKKFATGDGRATKNQMLAAARTVGGVKGKGISHDEADAIHLARYALRHPEEWKAHNG